MTLDPVLQEMINTVHEESVNTVTSVKNTFNQEYQDNLSKKLITENNLNYSEHIQDISVSRDIEKLANKELAAQLQVSNKIEEKSVPENPELKSTLSNKQSKTR